MTFDRKEGILRFLINYVYISQKINIHIYDYHKIIIIPCKFKELIILNGFIRWLGDRDWLFKCYKNKTMK